MDNDVESNKERVLEEQMRYRDFVLQVKRFLKYAPKGTNQKVLALEAKEFDHRLSTFAESFDQASINKLRKQLQKIYKTTEVS